MTQSRTVETYVVPQSNGMSGERDPGTFLWGSKSLGRRIMLAKVPLLSQEDLEALKEELWQTQASLNIEIESIRDSLISASQEEINRSPLIRALDKRKFAKLFLTECYKVYNDRKKREWQDQKEREKEIAKQEKQQRRIEQEKRNHEINLEEKAAARVANELRLELLRKETYQRVKSKEEVLQESVNRWVNNDFSRLAKQELGDDRYVRLKKEAFEMAFHKLEAQIGTRPPSDLERMMLQDLANQALGLAYEVPAESDSFSPG